MKIHLDRIGPEGKRIQVELEPSKLDLGDDGSANAESVRFEGRVDRSGLGVILQGTLQARVSMPCSRCLETCRISLQEKIRAVYLLEPETIRAEEDLEADQLEVSHLTEETLNLTESIREQLLLALPVKPVCREGCQGLCPQCGTNRNIHPCSCKPPPDPRLAGLGKILNQPRGEED